MTRVTMVLIALTLVSSGCDNPADSAPAAEVAEAKPTEGQTEEGKAQEALAAAEEQADPKGVEMLAISHENSKIGFVGSKVTGSHDGGFEKFSGQITLDPKAPEKSKITVDIDAATVFADDPKLTAHLRKDDFFDVAKHPKAKFTSTAIEVGGPDGATHTITGNLDLRGVTKSVTFPAKIEVTGEKVTAKAEFSIDRQLWGISYPGMPDNLIRDEVVIKLELSADRQTS